MTGLEPVRFEEGVVVLLDQRRLPAEEAWVRCASLPEVVEAIARMVVRGAPAIGVTAAWGLAAEAARAAETAADPAAFLEHVRGAARALEAARPTAVNLAWAVRRLVGVAERALADGLPVPDVADRLLAEARGIHEEDVEANRSIGRHGSMFVPDGARVLTHCNAGALATAGYGTALGVVRAAVEDGKRVHVFADETRPFLQGARLTAWELLHDGIEVTLVTDNMAGHLMARGEIDLVVVGADRVARNGDVANKIGTYTVAVLARRHGIPFYVAAPLSTLDPECPDGDAIPIEERPPEEVTTIGGVRVAPEGVKVRNPAFDVTPGELVTAIITEKGVLRPPWRRSIAEALGLADEPGENGDPGRGEEMPATPEETGPGEADAADRPGDPGEGSAPPRAGGEGGPADREETPAPAEAGGPGDPHAAGEPRDGEQDPGEAARGDAGFPDP